MLEHHRLWEEDLAKRAERISVFFAHALAETPCGGAEPEPPSPPPAAPLETTPKPENDAALQGLLGRCTDRTAWQRSNGGKGLVASQAEYRAYLRELERRNPLFDWRQMVRALHGHFHGVDN